MTRAATMASMPPATPTAPTAVIALNAAAMMLAGTNAVALPDSDSGAAVLLATDAVLLLCNGAVLLLL